MANIKNTKDGFRTCFRCKIELPATIEFFYKDSQRPLGISYECKCCLSKRKVGRDRRTERWANQTPEQRAKVIARSHKYNRTVKGRAQFMASAYKRIDAKKGHACDMTPKFLLDNIFSQQCTYCGTDDRIGCDRIDNNLGHTQANVRPACGACNIARGDRFTHEEMLVIGKAITHVLSLRGTTSE